MMKSDLAQTFIAYGRILNKKTVVRRSMMDGPNKRGSFRQVTHYIPEDDYDEYLRRVVPPTAALLRRYKKDNPSGNLSFHSAVRTLEPFALYIEEMCDEHFLRLQKYVGEKIDENTRKYAQRLENLAFLSTSSMEYESRMTSFTNGVSEPYGLEGRTDGERWDIMTRVDEGRLFATSMAVDAVDLMISEGLLRFDESKAPLNATKVIAKEYASVAALEKDNDTDVYFDSGRDPTYYDIVNDYVAELANATDAEKVAFLSGKLQEVNGYEQSNAEREAKAMLRGRRMVEEGEFALVEGVHYKRTGNKWVKAEDEAVVPKAPDFDDRLKENKEEMTRVIQGEHRRALGRVEALRNIRNNRKYRYEKKKFGMADALDVSETVTSPYETLRDKVLGEEDFVKRQHYIAQFVDKFTRPANPDEGIGWFYCVRSGAPLVPTFMRRLADAFLNKENYLAVVEQVCAQQGKLSDDESSWVDKYSGYAIVPVTFSTQEGYTEGGFKAVSREIIAKEDAALRTEAPAILTVDAQLTTNVVQAMTTFLGVDVGPSMDFIVQNTVKHISVVMPSKEEYAKAVELAKTKGKKKSESYEKKLHQAIIMLSLAYLHVAIQTSIPTVRTQKRHPGCVKSFAGYPLGDENDKSGLKYLTCVAYSIKSKVEPWDSIYKMKQEVLMDKVDKLLEKVVVPTFETQQRLLAKRADLQANPEVKVAEREGLVRWTTFRPLLVPVQPGVVEPVSGEFSGRLKEALKKGGKDQHDLIGTMQTKITKYTQKIQQLVEGVVKEGAPMLASHGGSPFLENACCNEGTPNTFGYFIEKAPDIAKHSEAATNLERTLADLHRMAQPSILFDPSNTKRVPDPVVADYSEETIYRGFIHYCKYHNQLPMGEDLRTICSEKPTGFDATEPIEEQIRKLKRDNYNYNSESLHQLMNIVYRRNVLPPIQSVEQTEVLSVHTIQSLLEHDEVLPNLFKERLNAMVEQGGEEVRAMKNYLAGVNQVMSKRLGTFFDQYGVDRALLACYDVNGCVPFLTRLFPNLIANKVNYSGVKPPKHWNLSEKHVGDFQNFLNNHYHKFYKLYEDEDVLEILAHVRATTVDFETLWEHVGIVDERMEALLRQFYFYVVLLEYVESEEDGGGVEETKGNDDDIADDDFAADIAEGNREKRNQKVALLFESYAHYLLSEQTAMGYTYETLMERVHRAKEKEKDMMTEYLRDMTDEQREIENMLKNNRLGKWNKGLQKGLREYQKGTYDEEREAMEKQAIAELKTGEKNVMNRDIYAMEHIAEEEAAQRIEAEEMRLDHLGEDDDFGERDGDEF